LLAQDNDTQTAWHMAAQRGKLEVLDKLWDLAMKELTTEELSNTFLLAKDGTERSAWHVAANSDNVEILEYLWECAKEKLNTEELKVNCS